jgi:hypothetical protein
MTSYMVINNSFDGIQPLDIPKSGHLTSCSCQDCVINKTPGMPINKFAYHLDTNIAYGPESNDPLSCQQTDFSCVDNIIYNAYQQPALVEPPRSRKNYNNDFGLTESPGFFEEQSACGGKGYWAAFDARLIDSFRGEKTILDRPSLQGSIPLNSIYDKKYENYGKNYTNYRSINAGQIQYYNDKSIGDPFFQPVYTIRSGTVARVFKDPMDSLKPYYDKIPDQKTLHNLSDDQQTRDTLSFREDIMSKQSSLMNRMKYTARWSAPNYE